MDQFALGLFPLVYAGYAQMKIKDYKQVRNKPETIALKVKIGFQLQISIIQIIELIVALFNQNLLSALCCLFLIIGLFYLFGITIIFHYESLLNYLPLIFLFNLICNEPILKLFDLLSLILSSLLVIYQRLRGDDSTQHNAFCQFFEKQDSFITQYLILLKFQPNSYSGEIELHELNAPTVQDQLLIHQQQHSTQLYINQTRQQQTKLDADIIEQNYDIWDKKIEVVDSSKIQIKRRVRSSQIIIEENSDDLSYPSFKEEIIKYNLNFQISEKRQSSQQEIKLDFDQIINSNDNNYEQQSSNIIQQQIIEIIDIDTLKEDVHPVEPIPFIKDNEYPDKLIVIPQQIQSELSISKQKDGELNIRNKSYEDTNDENKSFIKMEEETVKQIHSNTQKEYFLSIKQIKVDCLNADISETFTGIIQYNLKFTIQTEKQTFVSQCYKTIDEIKEVIKYIQEQTNLRVTLQDNDTTQNQMKTIDQFLQEVFSHQFYYCDKLFEQFGLLQLIQ